MNKRKKFGVQVTRWANVRTVALVYEIDGYGTITLFYKINFRGV